MLKSNGRYTIIKCILLLFFFYKKTIPLIKFTKTLLKNR